MARAVLQGIPVSAGIAVGKAFFANNRPQGTRREAIAATQITREVERLETALDATVREFEVSRDMLPRELRVQAGIIDSHLLICQDPWLKGEAVRSIREEHLCAEWALEKSVNVIGEAFNRLDSPYIRERIEDVRTVCRRILGHLSGTRETRSERSGTGILLAYDLTPADALGLSLSSVLSLATEQGGKTAHTGILARNLNLPAVVGVIGLCEEARDGDLLIVDGLRGKVLVDPSELELDEYARREERFLRYENETRKKALIPAETEDGHRIAVLANIESVDEAAAVLEAGGEGVGLVRTEFRYMARQDMPSEEELYRAYAGLVRSMAPRRVVFRTLDVGADKLPAMLPAGQEANPALGMRAIRFCMRHQDVFRRQLRAILRAGAEGNAALLFPLVSGTAELRQARTVLHETMQELDAADTPFARDMPVGIMVELPSAVLMADVLAREVDFFSIGTNDLIQYTLGVDRSNRQVAHLHQPLDPAVLRSVQYVVDQAHQAGIPVCVCGEMAADPYCLQVLLGMQVDQISVAPQAIPGVKHLIRRSSSEACRSLVRQVLEASSARDVNAIARHALYSRMPHDISFYISLLDADG